MKRIELMAPAGSKEAFLGAINAGADAVYLGGKKFGARAFASNFEVGEMPDLVRYAHLRGASVYVTINTLVFDDEVDELIRYTDELVKADVDALIIQDLGMLDLLHRRYPNMPIHASTQTNAHNPLQVGFLKELGASRVILARETPIETIRSIKETVDIEVEVFVHGALCVSYSGNCLFSSMVGHRSGNRGECGQPCRLPYTLLKDGEPISDQAYLMSTKDLMTLARLDELIASGVDALKIEGRMRKPEYVIQTVLSYRTALDASLAERPFDTEQEIDKLKRVFNRDYTDGYVLNAQPYTLNNAYRPNHMGIEVGTVDAFSRGKVTIRLKDSLAVNDGIRFLGEKDSGNVVSRIMTAEGLVTTAESGQTIILDSAEEVVPGSIVMKTLDHGLVQKLEALIDSNHPMIPLKGKAEIIVGKAMKLQIRDDRNHDIEVVSDFVVPLANSVPMGRETLKTSLEKLGNTPFYWESLEVDCDGLGFVPV
ncbi:MAG TPA: U32 family peptidase, partial [Bacillota bacterium]|nr:U32 family peptidase [Bacillota bacterium]